jgi:UDP-N-acetylglucosamine acyltransferase
MNEERWYRAHTFSTFGGGVDALAAIGGPPEDRSWKPEDDWFRPVIATTARVEAFATIDSGTKRHTAVGERSWIFKHSHIAHDVLVGKDCELAPGVVICGWCVIGDGVKIGVNACVRPYIKIGDGARIGCGAVVIRDVPAGEVWAGNPARKIRTRRWWTSTRVNIRDVLGALQR